MINGPDPSQLDRTKDLEEDPLAFAALEAGLCEALRPVDPPDGFAARVLARAAAQPASAVPAATRILPWPQRHRWFTGLIAAGLLLGVFEGEMAYKRMREQQQRILEATRQFQTTERITMRALAQAREQLQRAGVPLDLD